MMIPGPAVLRESGKLWGGPQRWCARRAGSQIALGCATYWALQICMRVVLRLNMIFILGVCASMLPHPSAWTRPGWRVAPVHVSCKPAHGGQMPKGPVAGGRVQALRPSLYRRGWRP